MKFCSKCGKELMDDAVVCVGCGCPVNTNAQQQYGAPQQQYGAPQQQYGMPQQQYGAPHPPMMNGNMQNPVVDRESSSTANCALLFAFLIPIVGLILGIVGTVKYKTPKFKTRCIIAIVVSILIWLISFVILEGIM